MAKVKLDHVSKSFGSQVAVDDICLTIEAGEIFFLLGPSGCGKSTLLRLIAGLHAPTKGRILFGDRDVTALGTDRRNAVMCFQSYALWPHMDARQNIRFGLEMRKVASKEADRRVEEAIELVQLGAFAHKKPNELSGGQQQRIALARALVVRPDCLLLDEPLSNLDAKLRLEMRSEIRRICKSSGLTAIYVTHDQKEALSIADRMVVMNIGRIEQSGRPQELYLHPRNKFVANFMGETNLVDGEVTSVASDGIHVRTQIGTLVSAHPNHAIRQGDAVSISIRPEAIRLAAHASPSANTFDAAVHDTMYLGEVAQHVVRVGNGHKIELRAFELNPRFVARDGVERRASASVDPQDVIVLPC